MIIIDNHEAEGAVPAMVELNGVRIWAVPHRDRTPAGLRKLPCGTVVRALPASRRDQFPEDLPARIAMPGNPSVSLPLSGLFLLHSGEVAAVYGAVVEPIGSQDDHGIE